MTRLLARFFSSAAKPKFIHLERGIVKVKGHDAAKLLQGLTTNDVYKLQPGQAQFSSFLNHKARVLFDFFLYKRDENDFLIECQRPYADDICVHLLIYKLKNDVEMVVETSKYKVFTSNYRPEGISGYKDQRCNWDLWRTIVDSKSATTFEGEEGTRDHYRTLRCQYGIPEGFREIKWFEAIPFEYNLDLMGAIDFSKGCYIGQELVSRVHNKGIVRKRVLPVKFQDSESYLEKKWIFNPDFKAAKNFDIGDEGYAARIRTNQEEISKYGTRYDSQMRTKIGNLVRMQGNVGLVHYRLDVMKTYPLAIFVDEETAKIHVAESFIPDWWPPGVLDNIDPFVPSKSSSQSFPPAEGKEDGE
jgi:tRNA-modifying protein YgfZ